MKQEPQSQDSAAADAPLDGSDEARALAAAARETAKRKHAEVVKAELPQALVVKKHKKAVPRSSSSTHTVAVPEGYAAQEERDPAVYGTLAEPRYTGTPAKSYPFELDTFQKTSVACLERRESVLVAAHTSAGKTVVAEYAIAMAFRDKQRVVYTSPLKALSNQKFRELQEEFGDVGLMTGDVVINPNANCVVMTTEILRSMIYRGSELLREVAWVVFDEIHYMQDRERGVVWEETIIFLQHDVKMVFLSATLSNANEFSQWVAYLHKQPCHVVYTDFRPTPLEHYVGPVGGGGLYKVMGDKGFNEKSFLHMKQDMEADKVAKAAAEEAEGEEDDNGGGGRGKRRGSRGGRGGGRGGRGRGRGRDNKNSYAAKLLDMQDHLTKLLRTMQAKHQEPLLVFSFSKRECEKYALACANPEFGNLCFASAEESEGIETVYNNMLQVLSPADRQLPALCYMLRILKRGIGVHHGGLLPILKEIVEILFQEGLIKVLFTTETFAMGLNMPARTVVFTNLKKWDGMEERYISSGEYIQMSGRAGRRGKDDRGTVIVCADDDLDMETCRGLMAGKPNPLLSSFRLSYYTLLNLLKRVEGGTDSLEYVIAHSFQQFQQEAARPRLEAELADLEAQSSALHVEGEAAIGEYKELRAKLVECQAQVLRAVQDPSVCLGFLRPGRIIRVKEGQVDWGWGVVVSVLRRPPKGNATTNAAVADAAAAAAAAAADGNGVDLQAVANSAAHCYIVDTLLPCKPGSVAAGVARPADPIGIGPSSSSSSAAAAANGGSADDAASSAAGGGGGQMSSEMTVVPVLLPLVAGFSSLRVTLPEDIRPLEVRQGMLTLLQDIAKQYPDGFPQLDPVADMGVNDPLLLSTIQEMDKLEQQLAKNPVFQAERDSERFAVYARKAALDERAEEIRQQLKGTLLAQFKQEAKARMSVLRKLNHINAEDTVLLKGRAACEIDTTDELLSTELMFNGCFHGLDKHQLLALVSCLVPCDKSTEKIMLAERLKDPLKQLQDTALSIAAMQRQAGLDCDDATYLDSFKPTLMDVFYDWSQGKSFAEVAAKTDIFEGSIIRVARRLDELMQQLTRAARVIGDETLALRFEESNETLRRGIMFSASLYL